MKPQWRAWGSWRDLQADPRRKLLQGKDLLWELHQEGLLHLDGGGGFGGCAARTAEAESRDAFGPPALLVPAMCLPASACQLPENPCTPGF